jgi:hypothetical protein
MYPLGAYYVWFFAESGEAVSRKDGHDFVIYMKDDRSKYIIFHGLEVPVHPYGSVYQCSLNVHLGGDEEGVEFS